jgi:hypothetical protein
VQFALSPFCPEREALLTYSPPAMQISNAGSRWMESKRREIAADGPTRYGTPAYFGPVSGVFDRDVMLPVKLLAGVPGLRNEQDLVREPDLRSLLEYCRVNGRFPPSVSASGGSNGTYNPFVEIASDGAPWMNEGNHRVMVADMLGWDYIPVEVRYFSGGEREGGPLSPDRIRFLDRAAHAAGHTPVNYGGWREGSAPAVVPMSSELELAVLERMPKYAVLDVADTLTAAFCDVGRGASLEQIFSYAADEAAKGRPRFDLEDANGNVVGRFCYQRDLPARVSVASGDGAVQVVIDLGDDAYNSTRAGLVASSLAQAGRALGAAMDSLDVTTNVAGTDHFMIVRSSGYGFVAKAEVALRACGFDLVSDEDILKQNRLSDVAGAWDLKMELPAWKDVDGSLQKHFYVKDPDRESFGLQHKARFVDNGGHGDFELVVTDADGHQVAAAFCEEEEP